MESTLRSLEKFRPTLQPKEVPAGCTVCAGFSTFREPSLMLAGSVGDAIAIESFLPL